MGGGQRELTFSWAKESSRKIFAAFQIQLRYSKTPNINLIEISDPTHEISPYSLGQLKFCVAAMLEFCQLSCKSQ